MTIICYPAHVSGGSQIEPSTGRVIGTALSRRRVISQMSLLGGNWRTPRAHCEAVHSAVTIADPVR